MSDCTEPDRLKCPRLCGDFCNEAETQKNVSDTPRTLEALTQVLDRDGRLEDDNAPFVLVRLTKTLERELNSAVEALKLCSAVIGSPNDGEWKSVDECNAAFDAAIEVIRAVKGDQP